MLDLSAFGLSEEQGARATLQLLSMGMLGYKVKLYKDQRRWWVVEAEGKDHSAFGSHLSLLESLSAVCGEVEHYCAVTNAESEET